MTETQCEADRYTSDMWKNALANVALLVTASETRRYAFIDGFNGKPREQVHHSARDAWDRGKHTAALLGYGSKPHHD